MSLNEEYAATRATLWDELVTCNHDRLERYVSSLIKGLNEIQVASHQKPSARSDLTKEAYTSKGHS